MARVLIVRAGGYLVGLPISAVVETMRPLSVRPAPGAPPFLLGVAIIRGEPLPVIDLGALLTATPAGVPAIVTKARFVTIRSGALRVSLAVSAVAGVREIDMSSLAATPPLLSQTLPEQVERLGVLDGEALAVLGTARLLPDSVALALVQGAAEGGAP